MRQILEAETPVVTIVGKTWLLHVTEVLRAKPDENLAMIGDTIRFLKDHGKMVIYDAEHSFDGYKDEPEYALATWQAAEKAGAECIVLCDTNGGCLPEEIARITAAPKASLNCPARHPHAQRLRRGRGQRAGGHRSRRHAGAGHHQRLRRTHRQLQSDQRHPAARISR